MVSIIRYSRGALLSVAKYVAKQIRNGKVAAIPADTTYGLAADAKNPSAVERIYIIKKRPLGQPVAIFVSNKKEIFDYIEPSTLANRIIKILPEKLTVIFPARKDTGLVRGKIIYKGTVGIRLPRFLFPRLVARYVGNPITATSANKHGSEPIYDPYELFDLDVDLIVDFGVLPKRKPSTIIDISSGRMKIIREGAISRNILRKLLRVLLDNNQKQKTLEPYYG